MCEAWIARGVAAFNVLMDAFQRFILAICAILSYLNLGDTQIRLWIRILHTTLYTQSPKMSSVANMFGF